MVGAVSSWRIPFHWGAFLFWMAPLSTLFMASRRSIGLGGRKKEPGEETERGTGVKRPPTKVFPELQDDPSMLNFPTLTSHLLLFQIEVFWYAKRNSFHVQRHSRLLPLFLLIDAIHLLRLLPPQVCAFLCPEGKCIWDTNEQAVKTVLGY